MPPRFAYWTILIDDKPTAFRAQYKDDLQPTLAQLLRTNPNSVMRWFTKGRLWDNPEQAQWAARNMIDAREKRPREWRPGGEHKDPRARFDKRRRDNTRASGVGVPPERYGAQAAASSREPLRGAKPPGSGAGGGAPARGEMRGAPRNSESREHKDPRARFNKQRHPTPRNFRKSEHDRGSKTTAGEGAGKAPWRPKPAGRPLRIPAKRQTHQQETRPGIIAPWPTSFVSSSR